MDTATSGGAYYEDHNTWDPAAGFALHGKDGFGGRHESSNADVDEQELIKAARAEAKRARLQKLDKAQKGKLAEEVLGEHAVFITRLAEVLKSGHGLPSVQIDYRHVTVEADALVGSAANPSLLSAAKALFSKVTFQKLPTRPVTVLTDVSGRILPGRLTLLLGPPGSGKSVFLQLLSGRLRSHKGLRIVGSVMYNGEELSSGSFVPRRTAGLVGQYDCHIPNMTVIQTTEFAGACQQDGTLETRTLAVVSNAANQQEMRKSASMLRTSALAEGGGSVAEASTASAAEAGGALEAVEEGRASGVAQRDSEDEEEPCDADRVADEELKFLETLKEAVTHRVKPYITLKLAGLTHVADTVVGNEQLRGVSGGERKRVTLAEVLVGPQWAILMDEISTGLDSATTHSVVKTLRDSCHALQRTFVVSLLQPPPEVLRLFDDILIITDGRVLYHGPVDDAFTFFASLGFVCPPRKDPASFIQETTTPLGQITYATPELLDARGVPAEMRDPARLLKKPPTKLLMPVAEMSTAFWERSDAGRALRAAMDEEVPADAPKHNAFALARNAYAKPWHQLSGLVLKRQMLLMRADRSYYVARIVQTLVLALIISTLYRPVGPTSPDPLAGGRKAVSLSSLSAIYISMMNMPQMGFVMAVKHVFYKHRDNHFFPPFSYVVGLALTQVPTSALEALLFSLITYWVSGLTAEVGRFFLFVLTAFSASNVLAGVFRTVAYFSPTMVAANAYGAMILLLMMLTNGFSILRPSIPPYLIWVYWSNPLAWAIRAMAVNELTAARWVPYGDQILDTFGMYPETKWVWYGNAYCWLYLVVLTAVGAVALMVTNPPTPQPTVPLEEQKKVLTQELLDQLQRAGSGNNVLGQRWSGAIASVVPTATSTQTSVTDAAEAASEAAENGAATLQPVVPLPATAEEDDEIIVAFTPITLVCNDICYYVPDPSGGTAPGVVKDTSDKELAGKLQLLHSISFSAEPGKLTALMGGSGAGKTTLMDVIAGRKTQGYTRGEILVNGHPKQQASWSRVVGYVEQMDIHSARVTVLESLQFSGRLRLDETTVSDAAVAALVQQTLATVELGALANSIVGEPGGDGLSIEQRKRLSIAVELVANPSVLFMDEPTSGLDARAAAIVMRAVRNVANSNRTIMVTIHQPSMEIFEVFDQLVLLQRGGRLTYFGALGVESSELIGYLEAQQGVQPITAGHNPATWMLEVTGGSMTTTFKASTLDFPTVYLDSDLRRANQQHAQQLAAADAAKAVAPLAVTGAYATSTFTQAKCLMHKYFLYYWLSPGYNFVRILMTTLIALLYGLTFINEGKAVRPGAPPVEVATVQNIMGLLFSMCIFLGMFNCMTVMPIVASERVVFYRERAASMYSAWPYAMAQGITELPYLAAQAIIMVSISYWLVGFQAEAWKFFYFVLMFFLSVTMYTFMGQFLVIATPGQLHAQLLAAALNQLFSYFNGFLVPYPQVPKGWQWLARASPTTWIIYGLASSQLADSDVPFVSSNPGGPATVGEFVQQFFGYDFGFVWWCVLIVFGYCVFFRLGAVVMLRYVSYQKR